MLKSVRIQNYKCLLDTEITLGSFNVLIGPNDSGKSSLLEALQIPRTDQFDDVVPMVWQKDKSRDIIIDFYGHTSAPFHYQIRIPAATGRAIESLDVGEKRVLETVYQGDLLFVKTHNTVLNLPPKRLALGQASLSEVHTAGVAGPTTEVWECLASTHTYRLDPYVMRAAVPALPNPVLNRRGDNLAAVLQAMLSGPDRKTVLDLEAKLNEAIPTLRGVSLSTLPNSALVVEFTLNTDARPPITIPCAQASDGAMLLTAFLVLAYGSTPRRLLIEEPENGLHPSRLEMVIDILRNISTGKVGNEPRQVVVTTHSPLLLNHVQPEEVRIFRRDKSRGSKVTSMDAAPNVGRLRQEFAAGELWYLFGEEDLVTGQAS